MSLYESKVEIWNSGRLPKGITPTTLTQKHESVLVNPDIAQVFYIRRLMEKVGRGTQLIVRKSEELGAPPPEWRNEAAGVTLTIFAADNASARPRSMDTLDLTDRQRKFLRALSPGDRFTLKSFHSRFARDVSERQARRCLSDLQKTGHVTQEGRGPSTVYKVVRKIS